MLLILPKTLFKFLIGPNLMKAAGIATWFQFTQWQCQFCHQGQKRMVVWDYFAVSLRLFCRFVHYFAVDLFTILPQFGNYTLPHYMECSCIFCPNFENFCPNNGQFFSFGDVTASPASPCRTLMGIIKSLTTVAVSKTLSPRIMYFTSPPNSDCQQSDSNWRSCCSSSRDLYWGPAVRLY